MSVTYARDMRVRQVSASEYRLPADTGEWLILRENAVWNVYDGDGRYWEDSSCRATPDEAIRAVIGPPR